MKLTGRSIPGIALIVVAATLLTVLFAYSPWNNSKPGERGVIKWDVISYYAYLPATFIYGDVTLGFLDDEDFVNDNKFWTYKLENGNYLIQTSMGLTFLYSPFFFTAHVLAPLCGETPDGYSNIYQLFLVFSSFFFTMLGLFYLGKILLRFFSPLVTGITILLVALGTNLFYYTVYEGPMAHSYSFALITIFLYLVIRWYESPTVARSLGIGLLYGLIVLVRPSNVIVGVLLLLWGVYSWKGLRDRFIFLFRRFHLLLIMAACFFIPWIPQMIYWKTVTGSWFFDSYGPSGSSFFFGAPQVFDLLFSYRKGWFLYTPLMLVAVAGIFFLKRRCREGIIPISVFLAIQVYLLASWWSWWNGGSFGLRSFVDIYGVMAVPLAAVVSRATDARKIVTAVTGVLLLFLLFLNQFQTNLYTRGFIHYSGMTREAYWLNFLNFSPSGASWHMLAIPDAQLARRGIYVEYYTGGDDPEMNTADPYSARESIRLEILSNPRLMRQIRRHAEREDMSMEKSIEMVVDRMFEMRITQ